MATNTVNEDQIDTDNDDAASANGHPIWVARNSEFNTILHSDLPLPSDRAEPLHLLVHSTHVFSAFRPAFALGRGTGIPLQVYAHIARMMHSLSVEMGLIEPRFSWANIVVSLPLTHSLAGFLSAIRFSNFEFVCSVDDGDSHGILHCVEMCEHIAERIDGASSLPSIPPEFRLPRIRRVKRVPNSMSSMVSSSSTSSMSFGSELQDGIGNENAHLHSSTSIDPRNCMSWNFALLLMAELKLSIRGALSRSTWFMDAVQLEERDVNHLLSFEFRVVLGLIEDERLGRKKRRRRNGDGDNDPLPSEDWLFKSALLAMIIPETKAGSATEMQRKRPTMMEVAQMIEEYVANTKSDSPYGERSQIMERVMRRIEMTRGGDQPKDGDGGNGFDEHLPRNNGNTSRDSSSAYTSDSNGNKGNPRSIGKDKRRRRFKGLQSKARLLYKIPLGAAAVPVALVAFPLILLIVVMRAMMNRGK